MYIGLDIGTSGSKADLIDENGKVHGSGQVNYNFSNTANGFRELDAQNVWEAVKNVSVMLHQEKSGYDNSFMFW